MSLRRAFLGQSRACAALGSPFMEQLMRLLAERLEPGRPVTDRVLDWPGDPSPNADSLPLRLAGALHALKLAGQALEPVYPPRKADDDALWTAVSAAFDTHSTHILRQLDTAPQTNEVRRSAVILSALAQIAETYDLPVELLELGASAGLNLRADRYRLDLPGATIGNHASKVGLAPDWTGPMPATRLPDVIARRGVDLSPLDPQLPEDRQRLLSYLWADQPDRIARTEAAISEAALTSAEVSRGDAGTWLQDILASPAPDRLRVVFHTVAWQYFPKDTAHRAKEAMARAKSPLVQLAMEADGGNGAAITLNHWPEGRSVALGRADFHGRWIAWH